jgi:hypothetical protein|tara:strand:- start:749 stop:1495 length:747 start_codon:yes stop_codon:yes gene_type:complete
MEYQEYQAEVNGIQRKLGLLGEIHGYNLTEYNFAVEVIPKFDIIAIEGTSLETSVLDRLGHFFYSVSNIALDKVTQRLPSIPSADDIAFDYSKEIIDLEENIDDFFPLKQQLALILDGLLGCFSIFNDFSYYKINGDPFIYGTKAYYDMLEEEVFPSSNLTERLSRYSLDDNMDERDCHMAKGSVDILKEKKGDVLVVCGEDHLDGIVANISNEVKLKETNIIDCQEIYEKYGHYRLIEQVPSEIVLF